MNDATTISMKMLPAPKPTLHDEWQAKWPDGTFELVGPKIQGNLEHYEQHNLVAHDDPALVLTGVPAEFDKLREWLAGKDIEGVVWHHLDGRMAKIKLRDFGLKRPK